MRKLFQYKRMGGTHYGTISINSCRRCLRRLMDGAMSHTVSTFLLTQERLCAPVCALLGVGACSFTQGIVHQKLWQVRDMAYSRIRKLPNTEPLFPAFNAGSMARSVTVWLSVRLSGGSGRPNFNRFGSDIDDVISFLR